MRAIYAILICFLFSAALTAQTPALDYLEKSTSVDIYTSHNFHASAYHDGYFYLAGEFWKDITFGDFSVAFPPGEDDPHWSFILKMSEEGEVVDLWHLESEQFTRINAMQFSPDGQSLTLLGMFWGDMRYGGTEWTSAFTSDAYIMNLSTDGDLNWSVQLGAQNETSFASGEALTIAADGTIYAAFEAGGTVNLDGTSVAFPEETHGGIIIRLTAAGEVTQSQQWQMYGFETFIDLTAMTMDTDGQVVIGGGLTGQGQLGELVFGDDSPNLQSFVVRMDGDLSINWAQQYIGGNSAVSNLCIFNDQLYVSLEYANFLNVDGTQINGSNSWRDLAIIAVDGEDNSTIVQNFRLAANGGTNGVYANAMTEYLGQLYIGGMYQGVVINDEDFTMGVVGSAEFQYPYILSLNTEGEITSNYDFWGSQGPSLLRVMAASEHRLCFGGEFFQRVLLEGESLETVNSTLFYGSFWDGVINSTDGSAGPQTGCIRRVYPTQVQDQLQVDAEGVNSMQIIDASGRTVATYSGHARELRLAHLPPGAYSLRVSCAAGTEVVRFVKAR